MSRSVKAFQTGWKLSKIPMAFLQRGIHFWDSGYKNGMASVRVEHIQLGFDSARIFVQIRGVVELGRIYENGRYYIIAFRPCFFDQWNMPGVQSSHGWNKTNGLSRSPNGIHPGSCLANCLKNSYSQCGGVFFQAPNIKVWNFKQRFISIFALF